ncbi:MAG: AAA family ATPase [Nitrososphaerota archaeon]
MRITKLPIILRLEPLEVSTLVLGPPGVGKSEIIRQYAEERAEELKLRFIDLDEADPSLALEDLKEVFAFKDLRLTDVADVSDLVGFPRVRDGFAEYVPWRWIYCLKYAAAGVLFLDELTNVQRQDIIAAAYKLTNERKLGFIKLPLTVQIIAAGNSPEHSSLANELPTPLVSRFQVIQVDPPSLQEWVDHMSRTYGSNWDTRIAGYLNCFLSDFIAVPKEPMTLQPYPCPRSWTRLGLKLKALSPSPSTASTSQKGLLEEIAQSLVGPEVGARFAAFCSINVDLEQLLHRPEQFSALNTEGKWLASTMLASRIMAKGVERPGLNLLGEMLKSGAEFVVLIFTILPAQSRLKLWESLRSDPGLRKQISALGAALQPYVF